MTHPALPPALPLVLAALTACTTPDLSADLKSTRAHLTEVTDQIGKEVATKAQQEKDRVESARILADQPVLALVGDCDTIAARETAKVLSDCRLEEEFDARDDPGNFTEVAEFFTIMDGYLIALEALASSQSEDEIKAQVAALEAAFGTPDAARPKAFEALGQALRDNKDLIGKGTGFLVNQIRLNALRRVIRKMQPIITDAVPIIAANLDSYDQPLLAAQNALLTAEVSVLNAQGSGNPTAYRTAVENLRKAHANFLSEQEKSPVVQLFLFRQAHTALYRRAIEGATATELVTLLEDLKDLNDAAGKDS